eukprot:CAMPEP_0205804456 /NCGR_PEP_ID=MMETSP0205-20121125/7380_1 /ASSEMBLY_ACC=CAM_ASM_000278 /TAXON_ID=36767 /ORGANISM="Euplotes focardii, Strain TN1" /LENGTH=245 /DNA_ID=CAMNT_0053074093 /DNA_START=15 /DNA_END=755 /DNA_ORIENTATION=+
MSKYDKALTVFAPDGNLFQVQYAFEAVEKGTSTIGIRGKDCVVLGVEKKPEVSSKNNNKSTLQDPRTIKKILPIDEHISITFAGLQADARILANRARLESQSYRYNMEDVPSVDYIAKFIARMQQKYTQRNSVRPFGVSVLVIGFDEEEKKPRLLLTEPSGAYSSWKAHAIGRNSKSLKTYLENNYEADLEEEKVIKLAVETLLESVESEKHIEIAIMRGDNKTEKIDSEVIDKVVEAIKKESRG